MFNSSVQLLMLLTGFGIIQGEKGSKSPIVKIPQGTIQGKELSSRGGHFFNAFKGIPYAKTLLRFGPPLAADGWKGILNATKFAPRCPQLTRDENVIGDEDCLYLNVYAPKKEQERQFLLPVMINIETGQLQMGGSDNSGPDYFMDEDVVLVTFNYRLNVFGFLSTGDEVVAGNMGLKDQLEALKWVQRNIHFFGGNPHQVTIFGESAGGSSVTFHLLSPLSKGLFNAAISQSGSALNSRFFTKNLYNATKKFAKKVGCISTASTITNKNLEIIHCLRGKTVSELVRGLAPERNILHETTQIFVATQEGKYSSPSPFLTDSPENLLRKRKFHNVPLIMTLTKDEGLLRYSALLIKSPDLLKELNENWFEVAPQAFLYYKLDLSYRMKHLISREIRHFYFKNQEIGMDSLENLTALYSDSMIMSSIKRHSLLHATRAPVYTAVIAYGGGIWSTIFQYGYTAPLGVAHGDDLQYFFNNNIYPKFSPGSRLEEISKNFIKIWTHFAKHRIPGPLTTSTRHIKMWKSVSTLELESDSINWLYLDDFPHISREPLRSRLAFWDFIEKLIDFDLMMRGKKRSTI